MAGPLYLSLSSTRSLAGVGVTGLAVALCAACSAVAPDDDPAAETTSVRSASAASVDAPPGADIDWTRVAAAAESSVVSVAVAGRQGSGEGSGVVFDDEGHVLTNNHVVAPAVGGGDVQVSLADARVFSAELVGNDPATDLAVLRITDPPDDIVALEFGDSEAVSVGQPVMALGNPLGLSHTVTLGIVSALDRPVTTEAQGVSPFEPAIPVVTNAIQTDAAVNPGNSGGALIDASGRLIGINSSIATLGGSAGGQSGSIGLGFAIPSNQAQWVAAELMDSGEVEHAYLGVTLRNVVAETDGVQREGAGISSVVADTPAAQAGLQAGEAILQVEDEIVASAESLVAQIRERPPGTQVSLTVASPDGGTRDITVEFGTRPQ